MSRYILLYRGKGGPPTLDSQRIQNTVGLEVVDVASPTMYLVEASEGALRQIKEMPGWEATPETYTQVPDTRKKVKQPL